MAATLAPQAVFWMEEAAVPPEIQGLVCPGMPSASARAVGCFYSPRS